jgi:hypothetical protein
MGRDKREIRGCYIIQIAGDSLLIDTLASGPRQKYDFWEFFWHFSYVYVKIQGNLVPGPIYMVESG